MNVMKLQAKIQETQQIIEEGLKQHARAEKQVDALEQQIHHHRGRLGVYVEMLQEEQKKAQTEAQKIEEIKTEMIKEEVAGETESEGEEQG